MVIRRVGPLSCAKIAGLLYAIIGFILGALISLFSTVGGLLGGMAANESGGAAFGALFGIGAIVMLPIIYGCMGFVMTLVAAWIYNLLAGAVGGIQIETTAP